MEVSKSFKDAVSKNDVSKVRIMLKDSLFTDPSFGKFNAMFALAKNMSGLFDPHEDRGEPFKPQSEWTKDYGDLLKSQIVPNFSHERLDHLKKVVQHLYPDLAKPKPQAAPKPTTTQSRATSQPTQSQSQSQSTMSYEEIRARDEREGRVANRAAEGAVAGAVVGGVAGAVVGVAASSTVIVPLAIGVVIGAVGGGFVGSNMRK
ncbi:MAG: hypothetical protein FWG68_08990 [Defluviitaleaceae bacterium]|nr:hypothetical protein [Defluviitaleaceae bacterium]